MKIRFVNNYDMKAALKKVREGIHPSHHLWGAYQMLQNGHNVQMPDFHQYPNFKHNRAGTWGDLNQQFQIVKNRDFDVLYSGSFDVIRLIARLRNFGLFSNPIVTVIHHKVGSKRYWKKHLTRLSLKGTDQIICLSNKVHDHLINDYCINKNQIHHLLWGPDLKFYGKPKPLGNYIVSAGKTGRDYDTLCTALKGLDIPSIIFCGKSNPPKKVPSNVKVSASQSNKNIISYKELLTWYQRAFLVAIPLQNMPILLGLTSLLDAMVVGRPAIVTKNPFLDIDVEAEGCGIWVEPGDVEGWRRAIIRLWNNPNEANDMGARGRELCENTFNINNFSQELEYIIQKTLLN
ncbi:glycosyltransferase [Thermodesulfobacteriota bacterium]